MMAISDTSPEIEAMQARIVHELSGEQRLLLALDMSYFSRELAKAGIRDRNPGWTEEQVTREFNRLLFSPGKLPPGL